MVDLIVGTSLYYLADRTLVKFWLNILIFRAKIWFVGAPSGGAHAVAQYKDRYIDNWRKELLPKAVFDEDGYIFKYPMILPIAIVKMAIGKVLRILGKR